MYDFKLVLEGIQMDYFISSIRRKGDISDNLIRSWYKFYSDQELVDIIFVDSSGERTGAHWLVLSLSSPFFTRLKDNYRDANDHNFYVCLVGVSSELLKDFLYFIYNGDINVEKNASSAFFKLITAFEIEMDDKSYNLPSLLTHQEEVYCWEEDVIVTLLDIQPNDANDPYLRNMYQFHLGKILVDITFVCSNNMELGAHLVILSAISPYIKKLFVPEPTTMIYFYMVDISVDLLRIFMKLVYMGSVVIKKQQLSEFLKLAGHFQIKVRTETTPLMRLDAVPADNPENELVPALEQLTEDVLGSPIRQQAECGLSSDSSTPERFILRRKRTRFKSTPIRTLNESDISSDNSTPDNLIERRKSRRISPIPIRKPSEPDLSSDNSTPDNLIERRKSRRITSNIIDVPASSDKNTDVIDVPASSNNNTEPEKVLESEDDIDTETIQVLSDTLESQDHDVIDKDTANHKATLEPTVPNVTDHGVLNLLEDSFNFLKVEGQTDDVLLSKSNTVNLSAPVGDCIGAKEKEANMKYKKLLIPLNRFDEPSHSKVVLIDSQILRQSVPLLILNDAALINESESLNENIRSTVTPDTLIVESVKQKICSEAVPRGSEEKNVGSVSTETSVIESTSEETFSGSPVLTRGKITKYKKKAEKIKKRLL